MSHLLKHVTRNFRRIYHNHRPVSFSRAFSSQAAPDQETVRKTDVERKEEKLELDLKKFNLAPRTVTKHPALPPCIKEMFLGEIDEKYFPYLEIIEKEHVDKYFKNRREIAQTFLSQTENEEKCIENLKSLGNLGYSVPQVFNGNGYEITETTLNSEIEGNNLKANSILNSHRMVIQAINDYGTEAQKSRYLPKLANGEMIGTVAIFEREAAPEDRPFHTQAKPVNDGFLLNGEKDFVINGEKSNLFLVIASSFKHDHAKNELHGVSAFIIDENEPGVLRGESIKTMGCEEVEKCKMTFSNVTVRSSNILGEVNQVENIAMKLIQLGRIQAAATANQVLRRILNNFAEYCTQTKILGGYVKDMELPQVRLGRMTTQIYALESMIYFTTQLSDAYEDQDVDLEIAATKLYAMQALIDCSLAPFHTIGPKSTLDDSEITKNLRDSIQMLAQGDTLDSVKMYLGYKAIEHIGNTNDVPEMVVKKRNPMMYPEGFFKTMFTRGTFDRIKLDRNYIYNLHPSLQPAAEMFELCLKRLRIAVEISLSRHGREILNAHAEVERLAQCATLLYAMLATISRASRSYCIGVRYADMEILLANTFCLETMNEINELTNKIDAGENMTNDLNHKTISKQLFTSKGYFYEHPLLRVF
uniref:CSON004970 protein n=1 Tax=Culicoides sonorensis TaxID=179676 RepID=A0A336KA01_CULSO